MKPSIWLLLVTLLGAVPVHSKEAAPLAADPAIEARLNVLAVDLRCLVCQNQSLADSNAPLAEDLRREIREQMQKGKSDREVIDFLVERYGDFVLYKPPLKTSTLLLWGGPFVLFFVGLAVLVGLLRKRTRASSDGPGTATQERARKLLEGAD